MAIEATERVLGHLEVEFSRSTVALSKAQGLHRRGQRWKQNNRWDQWQRREAPHGA